MSTNLKIEEAFPFLGKEKKMSDEVFNKCLDQLKEWRESETLKPLTSFGVCDANTLAIHKIANTGCHARFGNGLTRDPCLAGFSNTLHPDVLSDVWCDYILNHSFVSPLLPEQMTVEIYQKYGLIYFLDFHPHYVHLLNIISRFTGENQHIPATFTRLVMLGFHVDFAFALALNCDADAGLFLKTRSHLVVNPPRNAKGLLKLILKETGHTVPSKYSWQTTRAYIGVGAVFGATAGDYYSNSFWWSSDSFKNFLKKKLNGDLVVKEKVDPFGRKPPAVPSYPQTFNLNSYFPKGEFNLSYVAESVCEWIEEETGFNVRKDL